MTEQTLQTILNAHKTWVINPQKGKRANLQGANLQGANLQEAYLGDGVQWARIGPQGSRNDEIVYLYDPGSRDEAHTGCFTGTLAELEAAAQKKHAGTLYLQQYARAIAYLQTLREEAQQ